MIYELRLDERVFGVSKPYKVLTMPEQVVQNKNLIEESLESLDPQNPDAKSLFSSLTFLFCIISELIQGRGSRVHNHIFD